MNPRHVDILRRVVSAASAPFHEGAVVRIVRQWAEARGVDFARDAAGNVVVHLAGRARGGDSPGGRWWLTAHMDHPAFAATGQRGRTVRAIFRGTIAALYGPGERVRLHAPAGQVTAVVADKRPAGIAAWWTCRLMLEAAAAVPPGTIGTWDVPAFALRGRRVAACACDDQAGTAAVLCALDELAARGAPAGASALLTRAEEAGFVGALAACRLGTIPRGDYVLSVEASKAHAQAPLGGGAVVRVGDNTSTFDPELTAHLWAAAGELARRDGELRFARALMPGGTCESTAFCACGYRAAAVCLPLANYHNQGRGGRIAAERIDLGDFASLVALLATVAGGGGEPGETSAALRRRLDDLFAQRRALLEE